MKKAIISFLSIMTIIVSLKGQTGKAYQYSLTPDSREWASLDNQEAKLKALEIPEKTLKNMTTDDLVATCLAYPLFSNVFAFQTIHQGLSNLLTTSKTFQELLIRKDAGDKLLSLYETMNPDKVASITVLEDQGDYSFQFIYLQTLLAQKELLNNISIQNRKVIVKEVLTKANAMSNYPEIFGFQNTITQAYILTQILDLDSPKLKTMLDKEIRTFIEKKHDILSPQSAKDIFAFSKLFIEQ